MGICAWDLDGFGSVQPQQSPRTPRLTVRCEYTDSWMAPTEVSFRLSPRYGIRTAREAHDWFLAMMRKHEEFEVEIDEPGDWPMPFCSDTVKTVRVD